MPRVRPLVLNSDSHPPSASAILSSLVAIISRIRRRAASGTHAVAHTFPTARNENWIVVLLHEFAPKMRRIHHMRTAAVEWWAMGKFRVSRITSRLAAFGVQSVFLVAPPVDDERNRHTFAMDDVSSRKWGCREPRTSTIDPRA